MPEQPISIFWMRRDLRWDDNAALYHALKGPLPVLPVFIFDRHILDDLTIKQDARLMFIRDTLIDLSAKLSSKNCTIHYQYGTPMEAWKSILAHFNVRAVYVNEDYEPYARDRDEEISNLLGRSDIPFYSFKDQVIMGKEDIVKDNGEPYKVFTPYSRQWRTNLTEDHLISYTSGLQFDHFASHTEGPPPSLTDMGFEESDIMIPGDAISDKTLEEYARKRDFPAEKATSRIGLHLRFGTVSIRKIASQVKNISDTFLTELIWREFYMMILFHFPKVVTDNFYKKYDSINWKNDQTDFKKWCSGKTGYPIVDAGMRQLNETGFMHNRVRMIAASFLTKHLLIDWRWGEAYFADHLLDYELASNNGGWQWAAGTGTDAQPYFRIFNPWTQADKFDPDKNYIRKWVPEFGTEDYPKPMVDHQTARLRALDIYKAAVA